MPVLDAGSLGQDPPTMPGLDKAKWAGRINVAEDPFVYERIQARIYDDLPPPDDRGPIAKLLEENPIAFAIGAAVLAYVAVRALK